MPPEPWGIVEAEDRKGLGLTPFEAVHPLRLWHELVLKC